MVGRHLCLLFLFVSSTVSVAEEIEFDPPFECRQCAAWNEPQDAFRVYGNTYYVGTAGLASLLVDAGDVLVLFDGALPQSAPLVVDSIRKFEFDPKDVDFIGVSHAHFDHAGGVAALQRHSQARVVTSPAGVAALESGNLPPEDPQFGFGTARSSFPAISNVVAVSHDESITVGNVSIRALHTPGHTPGGMSWTWQSCEADRCLNIVYADSIGPVSAPGYRFSAGMDQKIRESAAIIAGLDCDILIVTHPDLFGLWDKLEQGTAALIDPQACKRYAESILASLDRRLSREAAE